MLLSSPSFKKFDMYKCHKWYHFREKNIWWAFTSKDIEKNNYKKYNFYKIYDMITCKKIKYDNK